MQGGMVASTARGGRACIHLDRRTLVGLLYGASDADWAHSLHRAPPLQALAATTNTRKRQMTPPPAEAAAAGGTAEGAAAGSSEAAPGGSVRGNQAARRARKAAGCLPGDWPERGVGAAARLTLLPGCRCAAGHKADDSAPAAKRPRSGGAATTVGLPWCTHRATCLATASL